MNYALRRVQEIGSGSRASGLSGFVLAPAYQKTPIYQQASILLWRWPDMEKLMGLARGLYELPISRSGRIKPLPL